VGGRKKETGHCRGENFAIGFLRNLLPYETWKRKALGETQATAKAVHFQVTQRARSIPRKRRCGQDSEHEIKQEKKQLYSLSDQRAMKVKWHLNKVREPHRKQSRPDSLTLQV
jgi:hypothetical protein